MKARMLLLLALVTTGCGYSRIVVEGHARTRVTPVIPVSVGFKVDLSKPERPMIDPSQAEQYLIEYRNSGINGQSSKDIARIADLLAKHGGTMAPTVPCKVYMLDGTEIDTIKANENYYASFPDGSKVMFDRINYRFYAV